MTRCVILSVNALIASFLAFGLVGSQTTSTEGLPSDARSDELSPTATTNVATAIINGTAFPYTPVFTIPSTADRGVSLIPNILDPQAVDAQTVCPGYTASNVVRNAYGFSAILSLAGEACNVYGTDIETLNLEVQYQSADRLSVQIYPAVIDDSNYTQYLIPDGWVNKPTLDSDANATTQLNDLQFSWSNDPTFSFSVVRKSTGDVVFDTTGTKLVFENQFVEFATSMPENYNLYGLGERIHGLRLGNNFTATIYAADVGDPIDYNLYGSHPFYLDTRYYEVSEDGELSLFTGNVSDTASDYLSYSHGVYLRNTHGQEVLLRPENVTWRTIGGSIDLYFFDGPSQPEVTRQYQEGAIGFPGMQQYWTFGFNQCRWGYANFSELQSVVDNFRNFDIPLETIWADIDYMDQYRDFTNDEVTYPLSQAGPFFERLAASNQHFIPIVDAAIYIPNPENASDAYPTYNRGNDTDSYLMNPDGSQYIGAVWPGYTVFPDWLSAGAGPWWTNEVLLWHREFNFSGMWIDMNEVASFCVGSCGSGNVTMNPVHPPFSLPGEPGNVIYGYPEGFNITNATEASIASSLSSAQATPTSASSASSSSTTPDYLRTTPTPGIRNINYPPYTINHVQGDLAVHAVSPNATHHDGTVEYDVHNIWGHQILNATYNALLELFPGKRPFILGRSTFAGSGKWSAHWGGDNASRWAYMFFSIPQALSFSLFGIPMFGADTCGFNGNTDMELCNRWMQMSAFFPFYRNHNTLSALSQEPYRWASVIDASKTAINIRYQLLPYMYTLFYYAHTTGSTVMRALAWEFPNEPSLAGVDTQFLLGPSILVTPVLEPLVSTVNGVFPGVGSGTVWYDWYNQTAVNAVAGQNTTIDAPLGHIPVYVKGGSILPLQQPGYTTRESRENPWSVLAALDLEGSATGQLYLDDGESLYPEDTLLVSLTVAENNLYASGVGTYESTNPLANITIMGVPHCGSQVTLNGEAVNFSYDNAGQRLTVTGLENATTTGAWSQDWILRWEYYSDATMWNDEDDNNPYGQAFDRRDSNTSDTAIPSSPSSRFNRPSTPSSTASSPTMNDDPDFLSRAQAPSNADEDQEDVSSSLPPKRGQYSSRIEQILHENSDLPIIITQAGKSLEGGGNFIQYTIRTGDVEVRRRYSEFASLRQTLEKLHPTLIIPPIPEKHSMADYAAKPTKAKEDAAIIDLRKRMLGVFLNRGRKMKEIREDGVWWRFLDPNASWSEVLHSHPVSSIPKSNMQAPPLDPANPTPAHKFLPIPSSSAKLKHSDHKTASGTPVTPPANSALPSAAAHTTPGPAIFGKFPPLNSDLPEHDLDPYFVNFESSSRELEHLLQGSLEKVNRRTLNHFSSLSEDLAELGARYNAFSLSEQSPTVAAAIEKIGQAVDSTYIATGDLSSSLTASFAEPMRESAQFAGIVRNVLRYRVLKRVQEQMTRDELEKKRRLLEQLENSEIEAKRIEQYLSSSVGPSSPPRRSTSSASRPSSEAQRQHRREEDTASIDSDFPTHHANPPSAEQGAPQTQQHSQVEGDLGSPTVTPHKKTPSGGNFITTKIFGRINHAIHGVVDVDPERTRRDQIGKTRERLTHLEQALEVTEKDVKDASQGVLRDLRRFQQEKEEDLKRYMLAYARCHIDWAKRNMASWEEAKNEVNGIEIR